MTLDPSLRPVRIWLFIGAFLVGAMVLVGGVTRATGSGLSITEWNLLIGVVPPLGDDAWQALFSKYLASPQGQLVNAQFTLSEFKQIFWWEYAHRLLGRVTGLVFVIPFAWFLVTVRLGRRLIRRLLLILLLGAFQGVLGWLMVASGLVDRPAVSHYRLAAHLLTALVTLSVILWTALDLASPSARSKDGIPRMFLVLVGVVTVQLLYGAFTAGLRAGFIFNTWPLMGSGWVPPGVVSHPPVWRDLVENPITIQFLHRSLAVLVLLATLAVVADLWRHGRDAVVRRSGTVLLLTVAVQFGLGILAVLHLPAHPVLLGTLHQAGGMLVVAALVLTGHAVARESNPPATNRADSAIAS